MPIIAAGALVGPQWLVLHQFDIACAFEGLHLRRIRFLRARHHGSLPSCVLGCAYDRLLPRHSGSDHAFVQREGPLLRPKLRVGQCPMA
jgi:hypothetical protein